MEEKKKPAVKPIKNAPEITSVEIMPGRIVKLHWIDAIGAKNYDIYRYDDGRRIKLERVGAEFNTYSDTTIDEDGSFEYNVVAVKKISANETATLASKRVTAEIKSVEAPTLQRIENDGNAIKIGWDGDESVSGFVVLRRFSFMKKAMPIATLYDGETEFKDKSFAEGQIIYYSIQSVIAGEDSNSYSAPSNELSSVILPVPVITRRGKSISGKVKLSVRLCAGADGYILFRRSEPNGEKFEVQRTAGIDSFDLLDSKKPKGRQYYSVACFKNSDDGKEFIGNESEIIAL